MLLILPIRTETEVRRTPHVNVILIGLNVLAFLVLDERFLGNAIGAFRDDYLTFQSTRPKLYQFFTYQFLHADIWHLLGNMLFLWVFGNSVNGKMGDLPYLLFYLASGVFAAWGYAIVYPETFFLVGASGSIAGITTAYLALFPRSHVTVMIWLFFVYFVDVSAMVIIGLKIIVWDNVIAPTIAGPDNVANKAHLAGYFFGFFGALIMLWLKAVQRDQFDILALWNRWHRRRQFAAMSAPGAGGRTSWSAGGRDEPVNPEELAARERRLDAMADLRSEIGTEIDRRDIAKASTLYEKLLAEDPRQCLAERQQLDVAREFYSTGRFEQAATAFDRYIACYPNSSELDNVRLLLGIIYARDLRRYDLADNLLSKSWETVRDEKRREQCFRWLQDVRSALGRPAPEV